jgi:hypothetical protein
MIKKKIKQSQDYIEKNRFILLLVATILVLVLPAVTNRGLIADLLYVTFMSFLFIQSIIVATTRRSKYHWFRNFVVVIMIIIFWLEPVGVKLTVLDAFRLILMSAFFIFVTYYLLKFIRIAKNVNGNMIITAINIYLLIGIVFGSLAYLFYLLIPDSYQIPAYIEKPDFVTFNYYSFITMSTVGYGDIVPKLPQSQILAYFTAITGQLYVAIIVAFLVGKLLMSHETKHSHTKD